MLILNYWVAYIQTEKIPLHCNNRPWKHGKQKVLLLSLLYEVITCVVSPVHTILCSRRPIVCVYCYFTHACVNVRHMFPMSIMPL